MYRWLIFALALTGCAVSPSAFTRPADVYHPVEYPLAYDAIYADLFWRCVTPKGGGIQVEGYAVSSMRSSMALIDFQVRLTARDAKGNILADRWKYGDLINADQFDPVPFAISLPAVDAVTRYDLYYHFTVPDGNGNGNGQARGDLRRDRARTVLVAAGLNYFGTIQDVCGARWQRKEEPPGS